LSSTLEEGILGGEKNLTSLFLGAAATLASSSLAHTFTCRPSAARDMRNHDDLFIDLLAAQVDDSLSPLRNLAHYRSYLLK
jgi:hypothetical protein